MVDFMENSHLQIDDDWGYHHFSGNAPGPGQVQAGSTAPASNRPRSAAWATQERSSMALLRRNVMEMAAHVRVVVNKFY